MILRLFEALAKLVDSLKASAIYWVPFKKELLI